MADRLIIAVRQSGSFQDLAISFHHPAYTVFSDA